MSRLPSFVLAALMSVSLPAFGHGGDRANDRRSQPESVKLAESLTVELLASRNLQARSPKARQARRAADVLAIAHERRDLLTLLVDSNPADVLRLALPAGARAAFPAPAQALIERRDSVEGVLEVIHVDMPGKQLDYYLYHLDTPKGQRRLHFAERPIRLPSGTRIKVRGVALGKDLVLADGGAASVTTVAAALPNTLGAQNTLVMLVNFSDQPGVQPFTQAHVQTQVFGPVSNYKWEASYQQTNLTGTVTPWMTIATTSAQCDYSAIASQGDAAAAALGHVLSNYKRRVYIFPWIDACDWAGLGSVGGNPSRSWINNGGTAVMNSVVAHELGHNLGLYHSHSLDCGANVVGGNCTSIEYGDSLDVMGGWGGAIAHFNAFQKERLGWLASGVSPPLTTVKSDTQVGTGQYQIGNMEAARNTTSRAIKIGNTRASCNSAPSEWYYVEKRDAVGYDSFIANYTNNLASSVVVHRVTEGDPDSSFLLDMTPVTTAGLDVGLSAGSSFTDPATGLVIQPVSAGVGFANVAVTYAPPSCNNPLQFNLSPTVTVWTAPGDIAQFTATVVNTDACNCPNTSYSVTPNVPAGWTGPTVQTGSLAPGASAQLAVNIGVPASAGAGFHDISVVASSLSNPGNTASKDASVAVIAPIALVNGVAVGPISAQTDQGLVYSLEVPAGKTSLVFTTTGGTGDADLYVRRALFPTTQNYDCASTSPSSTENCTINSPVAGTWYVFLHPFDDISNVTLKGQFSPADPILPTLSVSDVSLVEGNAGSKQAAFSVSLSQASTSVVTVDVATAPGTAAPGSDFTSSASPGFSIPAGQTGATFNVTVLGDIRVEGNETFTVNLSNPANATLADAQGVGRITNDDQAVLSISDVTVLEGAAGTNTTASFRINLSSPMPNPVTFNIATANGSAGAGDFTARSVTGRFLDAGRSSQLFEVSVLGDGTVEADETFTVTLSGVSGATLGDATALGTISNDDLPAAGASTSASTGGTPLRPIKTRRVKLR